MKKTDNIYQYPLLPFDQISNIRDLFQRSSKLFGDQTAIVAQKDIDGPVREISYTQLERDLAALALGLQRLLKLDPNQRDNKKIVLLGLNCYEWVLTYLATINSNQVIVPIDWQLSAKELAVLIKRSGASAVVFSGCLDQKIHELRGNYKEALVRAKTWIALDQSDYADTNIDFLIQDGRAIDGFFEQYHRAPLFNEVMCTLLFTSGTTAEPKGVMLSHKNLASDVVGCIQLQDMAQHVFLSILPLYHAFEFMAGCLLPLYRGSTIYYLAGGMSALAKNLQVAKPTALLAVPLIAEGSYKRIKAALPGKSEAEIAAAARGFFGGRLRKIIVGGAPLNPLIADKLEAMGIPTYQGYGITENSPVISVSRDQASKHATVGLPLPNIKVKIDHPNKDGVGEVIACGPTVMLGYYKNERKTDEALKDSWLYTGDYGYFDEDGFLYIVGRKKNIILGKNGKNVYPEELEFVLNNTPGVGEAVVYGKVTENDVDVAALIVPDMLALQEIEPSLVTNHDPAVVKKLLAGVVAKVNAENAKHKRIKHFQVVTGVPKTATGKIKRTTTAAAK